MKAGRVINGKYKLLEQVDENEKVLIFKALELSSGEFRALKLVRPKLLSREEQIDRLLKEIQNIALLRHENLVRVYDVDYVNRIFYIAMEWVEGKPLTEFVELRKEIPILSAIKVIRKLTYLFDYAEKQGLEYRSVRLTNIMLTGDFRVKILGFNLPRSAMVISGKELGKTRGIDPDIFFLGVVLFTLIEGKIPIKKRDFVVTDIRLLRYLEMDCDWKLSRTIESDLLKLLENLIYRSVTHNMRERISDFGEFQAMLDRIYRLQTRDERATAASVMETISPEFDYPDEEKLTKTGELSYRTMVYAAAITGLLMLIYALF